MFCIKLTTAAIVSPTITGTIFGSPEPALVTGHYQTFVAGIFCGFAVLVLSFRES